jgi:hypothetical protein
MGQPLHSACSRLDRVTLLLESGRKEDRHSGRSDFYLWARQCWHDMLGQVLHAPFPLRRIVEVVLDGQKRTESTGLVPQLFQLANTFVPVTDDTAVLKVVFHRDLTVGYVGRVLRQAKHVCIRQ